jgi:hypothetical protein
LCLDLIDRLATHFFLALLLELCKFAGFTDLQKTLNIFAVLKFRDTHQIVEEVFEDSHSLLDMSGGTLCRFLFGDGRNHLSGISVAQPTSQPNEIAVAPSDHPFRLYCPHLELKERRCADSEEPSSALSLWTK